MTGFPLPRRRLLRSSLLGLSLLGLACGDDGPTGPDTSGLELLVLRGDGQFGEPGTLLPIPLEVRVQSLSVGREEEGVKVRWEILDGVGARLDVGTSLTDSAGVTSARLTLGPGLGHYRVRASVRGMLSSPGEFGAQAVLTPELTLVPNHAVRAGDTIRLGGRNLSPDPDQDVVTFSGVRGRVVSVSSTELRVEVPPCLPTRWVDVRLRIGALTTPAASLQVLGGDAFLTLEPGEDRIFDAGEGMACFRLPPAHGARYLVVPHTTGTVGGAVYDIGLVGLAEHVPPAPHPSPSPRASFSPSGREEAPVDLPDLQWAWDAKLRAMEAELVRSRGAPSPGIEGDRAPAVEAGPARAPEVGDRREFNVLNAENQFEKVSARVQFITEHALVYLDETAPSGGFSTSDLAGFAWQFESPIHPTVTEAFGAESDLDGNGRVVILLTPAVNRLTPAGSDSYVGGFFFGLDLLEGRTGSNRGEIFYAVVPDPAGIHGPVLPRSILLYSLPAILAHEFEHMVHFNQRVLVAGAESQDALWLSEALAQMAEDLVGAAYQAIGDPDAAQQFQMGNWSRARRFLQDPGRVSVLATLPPGTLDERGAGWLLLKYLHGHDANGALLQRLTSSKRTGVANVTDVLDVRWEDLVTDWAGALFLDGLQVPVRVGFRFLGLNLRYVLSLFDGRFPLNPRALGGSSFSVTSSLWSSAPDYYIITSPETGGLALNVSGLEGRPPDPASGLRVLVVRLD